MREVERIDETAHTLRAGSLTRIGGRLGRAGYGADAPGIAGLSTPIRGVMAAGGTDVDGSSRR